MPIVCVSLRGSYLRYTEMSLQWGCCESVSSGENETDYAICSSCNKAYHFNCLHISEVQSQWKCQNCVRRKTRINEDTPIRCVAEFSKHDTPTVNVTKRSSKRPALQSPPQDAAKSLTREDVSEIVREVIKSEMKAATVELGSVLSNLFSQEIKTIKDDIKEIKSSMDFINSEYEDFKGEHRQTAENVKRLDTECTSMRSTINELNNRISMLEQQSRSNNIELQCVPENKSENIVSLMMNLSGFLKCELKNENIIYGARVPKANRTSPRPRSIVVQLSSVKIRDSLLAAAINYNKTNPADRLNTTHMGISGEKHPIYISEHLSPSNKSLHAATRAKAKECNFKYVWVRGGKIFVRKNETSDYIIIRDLTSLDKLVK